MIPWTLRTPWGKAIRIAAAAAIGLVYSGSTLRNTSPRYPDMQSLRQHLSEMGIRMVPTTPARPRREIVDADRDGAGDRVIGLPVVFSPDAEKRCPEGTAALTVFTTGTVVMFRKKRAELPFSIDDQADFGDRSVSLVFGTPACRLKIKIEQEVLRDGVWTRLAPAEELK
jgi:hypothetical protein